MSAQIDREEADVTGDPDRATALRRSADIWEAQANAIETGVLQAGGIKATWVKADRS
jgi:hypothetical protein